MKTRDMTEGRPLGLILAVAMPLTIGNIFQQLYTVVDAQVVGKVEGVGALAALGASDWFNWLWIGLICGLAQGFTIPMAQAFGAKDYERLRKCVGNAFTLSLITILAITAVSLASIRPALQLMGTPLEVRHLSIAYLTVIFAGYPIVMAYNLLAGILRSLGDGKTPLYAMVVASLINIVLDILFVSTFRWGVIGAAVATLIAQAVSSVYCWLRLQGVPCLHLEKTDFRLEGALCGHLMRLGLPVAAQNAIIGVGGMVVQSIVNQLGVTFMAGFTATNKLYGILEIAAVSYGFAVSTYAGQNLGAGKYERIRKGVHTGVLAGILTACVISAAMFLAGKPLVSSFINGTPEETTEAVRIACEFLYLMSALLPILYVLHIYRSALQGMGNTLMPMVSGFVELTMRTGSALLLPGLIGYQGVFWAEILAWTGADLVLLPSYYVMLRRICQNKRLSAASEKKANPS